MGGAGRVLAACTMSRGQPAPSPGASTSTPIRSPLRTHQLLDGNPDVTILRADVRDADAILTHPDTDRLLDFGLPIAVIFNGVLHFVPDSDDPAGLVARYRRAVAPGSHLVIGHATGQRRDPDEATAVVRAREVYRAAGDPVTPHDLAEVTALFAGTTLVEPGVMEVDRWHADHADPPPSQLAGYAGIGRVD